MFDLVIAGGAVVDGSGQPRFPAQIGISGDRIAAVVPPGHGALQAARRIDASGRVVAPGFIDSNSHVDWAVTGGDAPRLLRPLLAQGVTTAIGGACGFSPAPAPESRGGEVERVTAFLSEGRPRPWGASFSEFLAAVERQPLPLNVGFLVGQNTLRAAALQDVRRAALPGERRRLADLVREALEAGALGLAGNLGFTPGAFADREEILATLAPLAERGRLFAAHLRAYTVISDAYPVLGRTPHNLLAVREVIGLAERAGVGVQLGHLGFAGRRTWPTASRVMAEIDRALSRGVDVGLDVVPYPIGVGPLQMVFPLWFLRRLGSGSPAGPGVRLRLGISSRLQSLLLGLRFADVRLVRANDPGLASLEGLDFEQIGRRLGMSPLLAQVHLARVTSLAAAVMIDGFSGDRSDDRPLRAVLAHRKALVATNAALAARGVPNPAAHGAFPRVLGRYCREAGLLSMEEAVRRMTSMPAERYRLAGRGLIAEGHVADLVVFDPSTVSDSGWPERLDGPPRGIDHVVVSGAVAVENGAATGAAAGQVIRAA